MSKSALTLREGNLTFHFNANCQPQKYDDWAFYRRQFQSVAGGCKAIDFVCLEGDSAWLIEVKDYRQHPRIKTIDLDEELALKTRDTLAGLAAASMQATNGQKLFAREVFTKKKWRVALHIEQKRSRSKLFTPVADPAKIIMKLRKSLKAIDAHPKVVSIKKPAPGAPWSVTSP